MISWFICIAHLYKFLLMLWIIIGGCFNFLAIGSKHTEESLNLRFFCLFNLELICYHFKNKEIPNDPSPIGPQQLACLETGFFTRINCSQVQEGKW